MLASITGLITAIAALVGSVGSLIGILYVVRRSSPKERRDAAEQAADNMLMPTPKLIETKQVLDELAERRPPDDRHGQADGG